MKKMTLIAAVGPNGELGKDGGLPWPRNKSDMQFFRDTTMGGVVVMGANTFRGDLKGKPLDGRVNVVLTHDPMAPAYEVLRREDGVALRSCDAIPRLIEGRYPGKDVFLIGGWGAYSVGAARHWFDKAIIVRHPATYTNCDLFFKPVWLELCGLHCVEVSTDPRYPGLVFSHYAKKVEEPQ